MSDIFASPQLVEIFIYMICHNLCSNISWQKVSKTLVGKELSQRRTTFLKYRSIRGVEFLHFFSVLLKLCILCIHHQWIKSLKRSIQDLKSTNPIGDPYDRDISLDKTYQSELGMEVAIYSYLLIQKCLQTF